MPKDKGVVNFKRNILLATFRELHKTIKIQLCSSSGSDPQVFMATGDPGGSSTLEVHWGYMLYRCTGQLCVAGQYESVSSDVGRFSAGIGSVYEMYTWRIFSVCRDKNVYAAG